MKFSNFFKHFCLGIAQWCPNFRIRRASYLHRHKLGATLNALLQCKKHPTTRHGGALRERSYSSYSFLTSAVDRGEWSASRPGRALPPGKGPPVPIVQETGWTPETVWTQRTQEKSFASAGNRTSIARSFSC
jgi:hypothetical protein